MNSVVNLTHEAWALYERLDRERLAEAHRQVAATIKDIRRLVRLVRLTKRAYMRFERRAKRGT